MDCFHLTIAIGTLHDLPNTVSGTMLAIRVIIHTVICLVGMLQSEWKSLMCKSYSTLQIPQTRKQNMQCPVVETPLNKMFVGEGGGLSDHRHHS